MKYLGIAKRKNETLTMPDKFRETKEQSEYEAVQIGEDIFLLSAPLNLERLKQIEELTNRSIEEHRNTLKGLAR